MITTIEAAAVGRDRADGGPRACDGGLGRNILFFFEHRLAAAAVAGEGADRRVGIEGPCGLGEMDAWGVSAHAGLDSSGMMVSWHGPDRSKAHPDAH
jgi:hypothetical protein